MKKLSFSTLVLLIICFIVSCKKNAIEISTVSKAAIYLTPEEYQSVAFDNPKPLLDNDVKKLVTAFIKNKKIASIINSSDIVILEKWSEPLTEEAALLKEKALAQNAVSFCRVKFSSVKDNDAALVCTDARHPVVLAYYGDTTSMFTDSTGNKLLLSASSEIVKHEIQKTEHYRDSLRVKTRDKIAMSLGIDAASFDFDNIKDKIAVVGEPQLKATMVTDPYTLGAPVSSYGPYLGTRWSAGMPYNRLMDQSCPYNWLWDYRYAISSSIVATAQVLAFCQPTMTISGMSMNWNYLTQNQEIYETTDYFGSYVQDPLERRNMVAALMKGLTQSCGISYTCTGSTVNFNNIRTFLSSHKITMSNQQGLDVPTIKISIDNIKPVFMYGQTSTGAGNWWVVDGSYTTTGTLSYLPGYNYYIHANMGQGKSYSGYYLVGRDKSVTFDASFANFTKNFQMYANVMLQ